MNAQRWVLLLSMVGVLLSGCQSLSIGSKTAKADPAAEMMGNATAANASYFVDVQSDWLGSKSMTKPYRDGMTVQDAVEQSGALMTMRSIEIDLIRQEGVHLVRMPCSYNVSARHVEFEQDYALRPNDRVAIRPKKTNLLDSTLRALGGPPMR